MSDNMRVSEELQRFIDEYVDSRGSAGLLLFFANYPFARFNMRAITSNIDDKSARQQIHESLASLIDKGLLSRSVDNATELYALGEDSLVRRMVSQLKTLGLAQRRLLLSRVAV